MKVGTSMRKHSIRALSTITIGCCVLLNGCFKPPYNDFSNANHRMLKATAAGAVGGSVVGALAGNTVAGTVIGTTAGFAIGSYKQSRANLLTRLNENDIQYIQYGDTRTLLIPTDKYYVFDTAKLNDLQYPGLNEVVELIRKDNYSHIYVAGFSDDVGSKHFRTGLSQARAEAMLTFLWAHDIPARQLAAEGYGNRHPIANNATIRGSAMNRRIEVQWTVNSHHVKIRPPMMDKFGKMVS